jgi:hypothetical protein
MSTLTFKKECYAIVAEKTTKKGKKVTKTVEFADERPVAEKICEVLDRCFRKGAERYTVEFRRETIDSANFIVGVIAN